MIEIWTKTWKIFNNLREWLESKTVAISSKIIQKHRKILRNSASKSNIAAGICRAENSWKMRWTWEIWVEIIASKKKFPVKFS